jgi:hypothetical protein
MARKTYEFRTRQFNGYTASLPPVFTTKLWLVHGYVNGELQEMGFVEATDADTALAMGKANNPAATFVLENTLQRRR